MRKCLLAVLTLLGVAALIACANAESQRQLTLMIYMCGSNLESEYGSASADLQEMVEADFDPATTGVVVMCGGASAWTAQYNPEEATVLEIGRPPMAEKNGLRRLRWGDAAMNMGDPRTLTWFVQNCVEHYPARDYALILWNHGGGPLEGVCWDEVFASDNLTLTELDQALSGAQLPGKLRWIGFDACLMSSVETAAVCAPYADYMIASQETEPGSGWNYSFLERVDDGLDGGAMGEEIVRRYAEDAGDTQLTLTLSCVDLSKLDGVESAMDDLFGQLDGFLTPKHFSKISNGRRDAKSFGRASTGSEYDLVDLYSLSEQYADTAPEKARALQAALDGAVLASAGNQPNSHGLSVYYPYYNKAYYRDSWAERYDLLKFADGYHGFVADYADLWLGGRLTDWSGLTATAQPARPDGQTFTLPLTPDQAENFGYAQLNVMQWLSSGTGGDDAYYVKIIETGDVALDADNVLNADYDYKALYVTDADGNPLSTVSYRIVDDYYLIRVNLEDGKWMDHLSESFGPRDPNFNEDIISALNVRKAYLQCLPNAAGDGLDVVGVIDTRALSVEDGVDVFADDTLLNTGKQLTPEDIRKWKWIAFFKLPREYQEDADGNPLPFTQWPDPNDNGHILISTQEVDNTRPWHLRFIDQQLTAHRLYAQYIVYDSQGNPAGSNLMQVHNPNLTRLGTYDEALYASDNFTLTATGIDLARSELDSGLYLYFKLTNRRGGARAVSVSAKRLWLNGCVLDHSYELSPMLGADGEVEYVLYIPSAHLPALLESDIERLRFDVSIVNAGRSLEEKLAGEGEETATVEWRVPLDVSAIHTPEALPVLAEARIDDVDYRLIAMEAADACVTLTVRVENLGDAPVEGVWHDSALIDGGLWEYAVEDRSFKVPGQSWIVREVKAYERPEMNDITNHHREGLAGVRYPEYWGAEAIREMEFVDWDDNILRFELAEPFALNDSGVSGGTFAPHAGARLLETGELTVDLVGAYMRSGRLYLVTDVENRSAVTINVYARYAKADGESLKFNLWDASGSGFFDSDAPIDAGRTVRRVLEISSDDSEIDLRKTETLEMGLSYQIEGVEMWQLCALSTLSVAGNLTDRELQTGALWPEHFIAVSEGEKVENLPRDPKTLVDVTWNAPGDAVDYAVKLRVPLTDAQAEAFESARLMLAYDNGDRQQLVIRPVVEVELRDHGLSCEFNGLVLRIDTAKLPMTQRITRTPEGWRYDISGLSVYTDRTASRILYDTFTEMAVLVDPANRQARVERVGYAHVEGDQFVEASPGTGEHLTALEYLALVAEDYDDVTEGRTDQYSNNMTGEHGELPDGVVHFLVCPAADFDPVVKLYVTNRDGSEYVLTADWQDAVADG